MRLLSSCEGAVGKRAIGAAYQLLFHRLIRFYEAISSENAAS